MKKLFFIPLFFLVIACNQTKAPSNAPQDTVSYGLATTPDHLDPFQATSADSRVVLFNIFEGLFKPAPDGSLIPAVASGYEVSPDFMTYTVTLKENVIFHNDKTVTAGCAVFAQQGYRV